MILVTGAGGFIGGHIARTLAASGLDLRVVIHERGFDPGAAPPGAPGARGTIEIVRADLAALPLPANLLDGVGTVVHAAARLAGARVSEPAMRAMNAEAPARILEAAARAGAGRFIQISSGGLLGATGDSPAGEDFLPRPLSPYERSKWSGEQAVSEAARRLGMPLAVLRPALVYGPGDSHLTARLRAARGRFRVLLDGGRALCHPVHVSDVTECVRLCIVSSTPVEGVYHVAGERPVAWREWLDTIAAATGSHPVSIPLPLGPVRAAARVLELAAGAVGRKSPLNLERLDSISVSHAFDIGRARRDIGWRPLVPLREGVGAAAGVLRACGGAGFTASSPP